MTRAESVAERTWIIRTPLPGHSFGCLNSYLVEGDEHVALIDAPWSSPETIAELETGIRETGHAPEEISYVLVTHYHEDHSGAAGTMRRMRGARIGIHPADAEVLRWRAGDGARFRQELVDWIDATGLDEQSREFALTQFDELQALGDTVDVDLDLDDGTRIDLGGRTLEVLHTPGHTRGHVALLDRRRRLAFTGDHVFPHRRANATARPVSCARPIGDYWRSMERLLSAKPDLILPGHEAPFSGLARRAGQLRRIARVKLAEAVGLAERATAWEIAQHVRRKRAWQDLDPNAQLAATGEVLGYLIEAESLGEVVREGATPVWYRGDPPPTRRRLL